MVILSWGLKPLICQFRSIWQPQSTCQFSPKHRQIQTDINKLSSVHHITAHTSFPPPQSPSHPFGPIPATNPGHTAIPRPQHAQLRKPGTMLDRGRGRETVGEMLKYRLNHSRRPQLGLWSGGCGLSLVRLIGKLRQVEHLDLFVLIGDAGARQTHGVYRGLIML